MRLETRGRLGIVAAWVVGLLAASGVGAIETERVPVTATSTPFIAAFDLSSYGYTEDELFVGGLGNVYGYDSDGEVHLAIADVPYRTRMLVRRPTPRRFNGVVLFELMNPTAGHDIDFEWHNTRELLLADGYAWVGLTMKDTAINFLKGWDPERYASLAMPDRGLAYDIFAQVAALLREPSNPDNPLAGYPVQVVIGTGYSQSADYLTTFSNEFHATALAANGRPAFDGYLHTGGNAAARRLSNAEPEFYFDDRRRLNRVDAPMIRVQSETEIAIFTPSSALVRQPDSATFRLYEIAGGSHGDGDLLRRTGEVIARDRGIPVLPTCGEALSPLAIGPVHRSSLWLLVRWIRHGEAPPPGRLLELDEDGLVLRDDFGNALGGVRLPTIDAPLGTFEPGNSGPPPCPFAGSFTAFDTATLDDLYPSHGRYVSQVVRSAVDGIREGHLLPSDAVRLVIEAARSTVGR